MRPGLLRAAMFSSWIAVLGVTSADPGSEPQFAPVVAQERPASKPLPEPGRGPAQEASFALLDDLAAQGSFLQEVEPNDTDSSATPLGGSDVLAIGTILPAGDVDWWSFTGNMGDRVYAALQTAASSELVNGGNSQLRLYKPNGNVLVELDEDDGTFNDASSSIAGAELQTAGTYYLQVRHFAAGSQLRPYYLHFRRMSGTPTAEAESNNTPATANPMPVTGWVSGVRSTSTDIDYYAMVLNAGDTVFLSLDVDPERNDAPALGGWDGRLGFGLFGDAGNQLLVANDFGAGVSGNPRSEALFMTVKYAGTYYVTVDSPSSDSGATYTYGLAASIHRAAAIGANCQTYSSGDVNLAIGPVNGSVTNSSIFVPGNPRIEDLNVSIVLDHAVMADIDAALLSPAGNQNSLFTDVGALTPGGQTKMDLDLDDEAGVPIGFYTVMKGMAYQPELDYRLAWFKGESAGGAWTLRLRDDANPGSGGTLTSWSLTICEPPPQVCEGSVVTVYASTFESGPDGFTHSGTQDEWARGSPTSGVVTGCHSGTNCWKTDLTGNYNGGSDQSLLSPNIAIPALTKPILVSWAQKYQMENASFDTFFVEIREPGPANARTLFRHLDATMQDFVGSPIAAVNESAGWGLVTRRIDAYANKTIQLQWNLTSDSSLFFPGLAVDDVTVTGCLCTAAGCDDGSPCTDDVCDAVQGCVHTILTGACSDGNACTTGDACSNGVCLGTAVTCNDGDPCTIDSCNPESGCVFTPLQCDDGNPCTNDACAGGTCTHANNVLSCNDSSVCTVADRCSGGVCAGIPVSCNDGDACTDDGCNALSGCTHTPTSCDDSEVCTDDSCDSQLGCLYAPHSCDDGNACTDDNCAPQLGCLYAPHSCDDGNACTDDSCDPQLGCQHAPHSCDDADACTDDSCDSQLGCQHAPHSCDDADACTDDGCDSQLGCQYAPHSCDDADACTDDGCDSQLGCQYAPHSCDDADPCTDDGCDPQTGCQYALHCDDGSVCTTDSCDPGTGACSATTISCDDADACTDDGCDSQLGCQHAPHSCDDADACTDDGCDSQLGCQYAPHSCDDADPCTDDGCDPQLGCQYAPHCDDGDACTTDTCDAQGACATLPVTSPEEVLGVAFGADKQTISWSVTSRAVSYDLVRGDLASLPAGSGVEACSGAIATTSAVDPQVPPPMAGFWYLVRGANPCAPPGSYGNGSDGSPRLTATCP